MTSLPVYSLPCAWAAFASTGVVGWGGGRRRQLKADNMTAGNYYSIENDFDKPARVMFSQGCEVSSAAAGDSSMAG